MVASRLSSLRPGFRAAFRHRVPSRFSQPAGRRTYVPESLQERVATGSDRPWQLAAVAITIPGLMYLRKGIRPFHSGPGAMQAQHARMEARPEPRAEQPQAEPSPAAESSPRAKFEAAVERTRMGSESASSSGSESEGEATPSSASSEQGEYAESAEGQAEMQAPRGPEK